MDHIIWLWVRCRPLYIGERFQVTVTAVVPGLTSLTSFSVQLVSTSKLAQAHRQSYSAACEMRSKLRYQAWPLECASTCLHALLLPVAD